MDTIKRVFRENKFFISFLIFLALFRGSVADWHPVPTGSMKPTIVEWDFIWENKLAYDVMLPFSGVSLTQTGEPERGDIVVFYSDKADKRLIKRVVGIPGDTVEVRDSRLIINGQTSEYDGEAGAKFVPVREVDRESGLYAVEKNDFVPQHIVTLKPSVHHALKNYSEIQIPDAHYFVMGDNRDNSADSRAYGVVPRGELRGHATHVLLSIRNFGWKLWQWRPRWERFWMPMI